MKNTFLIVFISILFGACIGDDIILDTVEETLKITSQATSLAVGESFQFEARYTNNVGQTEEDVISWRSSDKDLLTIDANGLATGINQGNVTVIAEVTLADGSLLTEEMGVEVSMVTTVVETPTDRSGIIATTSSYLLEGDFTITKNNNVLVLSIAENYKASRALPGLYIYLTNNPNSINDALEIGAVEVFEGAHTYEIPNVELSTYDYVLYFCKPFRVKVGDGEIN